MSDGEDTTDEKRPNPRKVREGIVISTKMDKTVVVAIVERGASPSLRQDDAAHHVACYAHDETNDVREGDRVRITETRPLSKNKRWRVTEILERAR